MIEPSPPPGAGTFRARLAVVLAAWLALLPGPGCGVSPSETASLAGADLALLDLDGQPHAPLAGRAGDVVAVVFVAVDCPIANATLPEIGRIAQRLHDAGGRLYLVHPGRDVTPAEATQHAQEFGLAMPVLLDGDQALVEALDARVTPEAFVLHFDADDSPRVVYRGRVDDLYADLGRRRAAATRHDLAAAVQAALAGQAIEPGSAAVGCLIERRP